jgi:hypothetical protein
MKEPIELLKERLLEIDSILDSVTDEMERNKIIELYNRYVAAHNLIKANLFTNFKSEKYKPNENQILLDIIDKKNEQIESQRKKIKLYYSRWHHMKLRNKEKKARK